MDPFKLFDVDPVLAEDGKWFDFREGARIKVARASNKRFRKVVRQKLKPYGAFRQVPDDIMERVTCEAMADAVLLGWEGFTSGGEPLVYSKATALRLLTDLPDFRDEVSAIAGSYDDFLRTEESVQEKNLPTA